MSYLLDTNVISEFTSPQPNAAVVVWLTEHQHHSLYLSVITIGEIQQGIQRLPISKKRDGLERWLQQELLVEYANFILPLDMNTMLQWGTLTAQLVQQGNKMPVMDALIAATAVQHQLTLVTRNISDFASTNIPLINPWMQSGEE
jgi:predicted nucleic acid-binding protein